eukprot:CAMPEP_0203965914 /NCGR_PEP_ID=MMETSP0359-20131031/95288_1 /ASSEMBLY_ACC=CAM_ASM_000338 /TAXON_ID=268821 /ORGANISM="Scrippsiella Hangoei, Strain SHTV-5" /LENGTH=53 /DNA_ID=CAMNT_0050903049 /DNA_START=242 /DNA_END=400 /DNA_ORIENTATION=+
MPGNYPLAGQELVHAQQAHSLQEGLSLRLEPCPEEAVAAWISSPPRSPPGLAD